MKQLNNETMKVSVIIITRNRAKMLSGCLESLVKQTRLPDEVIVIDNASSDNTKKVITHYSSSESRAESRESREVNNEAMKQLNNQTTDNSSRLARTVTFGMSPKLYIRYVYEKQVGIPYARNKGLQHATGELILMLDDDCEADKFWVERMAKAHKKYPKAWVIQGKTFSLPYKNPYSIFAEFERFLYLKNSTRKYFLRMKDYFRKNFKDEINILICDTKNFSIKTSYLKKNKLSFDTRFYRGSDTDFGKQILQKNGIIMFCPSAMVGHYERSTLVEFLKQRWQFGRTWARIGAKWKTPSFIANLPRPKMLFALPLFCRILNQWHNLPVFIVFLFLDRLYRLNGWFYEKKQNNI